MGWIDGEVGRRARALVTPPHQEPFRSYHNMRHPLEMLAVADALGVELSAAQCLAVLFHDVVNVAGVPAGTCEKASAAMLAAHAPYLGVAPGEARAASAIVLATDHETASPGIEADLVLDLDLLRLAQPYERFVAHSDDIHHEWRHLVPDRTRFMHHRAAFLCGFARRGRIYRTELFDESAARRNVAAFAREFG